MMASFQKVKPQMRRAKVLLIGEAGAGKTHAALTFPKPVVIDAEGSIEWFADRFDFQAAPTKSYAEARDLVQQVRNGQVDCETLIVDGATTIYNGLINVASDGGAKDLRPLDWGRIKRKFSSFIDELYHKVNVHVVFIGWTSTEYARAGTTVDGNKVKPNDLVAIGEKFDGDKKTMHAFDFVLKVLGNDGKRTRAQVLKSRSGKLVAGQIINDFSWLTIEPLLNTLAGERTYQGMTDEDQEERDHAVLEPERPARGARSGAADWESIVADLLQRGLIATKGDLRAWAAANVPGCETIAQKATFAHAEAVEAWLRAHPAVDVGEPSLLDAPTLLDDGGDDDGDPTAGEDQPMTGRQRRLLFKLHGELGDSDADRRALYMRIAHVTSSTMLSKGFARLCIDDRNAALDARNAG